MQGLKRPHPKNPIKSRPGEFQPEPGTAADNDLFGPSFIGPNSCHIGLARPIQIIERIRLCCYQAVLAQ